MRRIPGVGIAIRCDPIVIPERTVLDRRQEPRDAVLRVDARPGDLLRDDVDVHVARVVQGGTPCPRAVVWLEGVGVDASASHSGG